jgi:hypothetical protein
MHGTENKSSNTLVGELEKRGRLVTRLRPGQSGVPGKSARFSSSLEVQTGSGAHAASYSMNTEVLFTTVKRLGRKDNHLLPSRAVESESEGIFSWSRSR